MVLHVSTFMSFCDYMAVSASMIKSWMLSSSEFRMVNQAEKNKKCISWNLDFEKVKGKVQVFMWGSFSLLMCVLFGCILMDCLVFLPLYLWPAIQWCHFTIKDKGPPHAVLLICDTSFQSANHYDLPNYLMKNLVCTTNCTIINFTTKSEREKSNRCDEKRYKQLVLQYKLSYD